MTIAYPALPHGTIPAAEPEEPVMKRRIRHPAGLGIISAAAATALSLGTAAPASANVTGALGYSATTCGYQVNSALSGQAFNDVRATVTFPFVTGGRTQANLILQGASGAGPTAELSLVYNGGSSNVWTLSWGYSSSGRPALSVAIPVTLVTNSPFYLEIHYSTAGHELVFLAGREGAPVVRERVSGVSATFGAPAAQVASVAQPADTLPVGAPEGLFSRVGVTRLLSPADPASPTQRLTFAAEPLHETLATVSGQMVAPGNLPTLSPTSLGAGSQFHVTATD
jgi:hypothetical protein